MALIRLTRDEVGKGVLPPICLVCGAQAPVSKLIRFTWAPLWTHLMLPLGLMTCLGIWLWVIFRVMKHRAMTVYTPLCEKHKHYWLKRRMVIPVGVFGTLAALVFVMFGLSDGQGPPTVALLLPFGLLLISTLVSVALLFRGTRVLGITGEEITFDGVDPRFVAAVETGRQEYEQELKDWVERKNR
jgi:hypothetical protein